MANGEVLFEAPWQGRVFGMAAALADAGVFSWSAFQAALIEEIASAPEGEGEYAYYDHFQRALERLLSEGDFVDRARLEVVSAELLARPHGHDH